MRTRVLLMPVLAALSLLVTSTAATAGTLITRGDAQARLEAGLTGGSAISANAPQAEGAPNVREADIRLRSNGRHYCADDWHVAVVADIQGGDRASAAAILSQDLFAITLDGTPLDLTVTPVKPVSQSEALGSSAPLWDVSAGAVLSPAHLPAGQHTVVFRLTNAGLGIDFTHTIVIFVDPSGTGICLV